MNDPPRLLDQGSDDFERSLLSAAEVDRGSREAQVRCMTAVLATVPLVPAVAVASSSSVALAAVKAAAIGVVLGLSLSGAGVLVNDRLVAAKSDRTQAMQSGARSQSNRSKATTARSRSAAPPNSAVAAAPLAPEAETSPEPTDPARPSLAAGALPRAQRAVSESATEAELTAPLSPLESSGSSSETVAKAPPLPPDQRLEREVTLLDRARQALSHGDLASSRSALDQYQREFPAGALTLEATVLRAQELIADGHRQQAEALTRRFLVTHPTGAYAERLRAILDTPR